MDFFCIDEIGLCFICKLFNYRGLNDIASYNVFFVEDSEAYNNIINCDKSAN